MSEKWRQSEICIVINDKSQGNIAKQLRCDELLYCTFVTQSASERIFKIAEQLAKLQAKRLTVSCAPFILHFFSSKMLISPDKLNNGQKLLLIIVMLTGRLSTNIKLL